MNIVYLSLVYTVWFMSTYFIILYLLIFIQKRSVFYKNIELKEGKPKITVILPAFNEEDTIKASIHSLLSMDYPQERLEIILVNDGSTDRTGEVMEEYRDVENITVVNNKVNQGKARCLNKGLELSRSRYIACMDSDSRIKPDAIEKSLGFFRDPDVGAVTIRIDVHEPRTLLEKIIGVEYAIGLSLTLKALSYINSIHVTPGPFSIYRSDVLREMGGFDEESITEDLEIAYRLQEHGYRIENCLSTRVYTTVPRDLKSLYNQRIRWYSGALQTVYKYKKLMFNRENGCFGMFFLPFNYGVILLGLILFLSSLYMTSSNIYTRVSYLGFIDYDLMSLINFEVIDPLAISILYLFAVSSIGASIVLTLVSFRVLHKNIKKNLTGLVGFILFFILYQVFWLGSFYSVLFNREIKWR